MSDAVPEFCRLVSLARLGSQPFRQEIEATPDECGRLARRFDLVTLDRLTATVSLQRQKGAAVLLEAVFEAEFAQTCVVSLEPVPAAVSASFSLLYGPVGNDLPEIELGVEETAFEPLTGEAIDIGEAVAQELSLALPEFPRHPDAAIDAAATAAPENAPLAGLASLHKPTQD